MAKLHFDITGDNKELLRSLRQAQDSMVETISSIEQGGKKIDAEMTGMGDSIEGTFKRIAQVAGGLFAMQQVKDFFSQVVSVRKEFQAIESSFSTLLGSDMAGKKMFADITQYAVTTPLLEKDLAKAAQTMLGFGIETGKVMPVLRQIGDISMGDSQKLQSLTLAFSQASATGKLMGQDLLQMINAGFNPLAEMARTTGRSMAELKQDMSDGKISVEMLEGAFRTATDEGGKFHGMLEKISQGMSGAFSNLEGAVQKLYNEAGTKIEKPLVDGANAATEAVNYLSGNLDSVSGIITNIVVAFGTYKAATMAVAAAQAASSAISTAAYEAELAQIQGIIAMKNLEVGGNGEVVMAKGAEATARQMALAAAKEEAMAVLAGLQAKSEEAALNLTVARSEQAMAQARLSSEEQGILMREQELAAAIATGDGIKIETAENNLNTAALDRNRAAKALKTATDKTEAAQLAANNAAKIADTAATHANAVAATTDAAATSVLTRAKLALSAAVNKVTAAMAKNPWMLAAAAIAALVVTAKELYDTFAEHKKQQEELREQIEKTANAGKDLKTSLKDLQDNGIKKMQTETAGLQAKYKTLQERWKALGGDARLQKRFVNENQQAFHDLGYEVTSVSTAEDFLVKNTSAVVQALMARAEAAAYQQMATEAYKKQIQKQMDVKNATSGFRTAKKGMRMEELNDYEFQAIKEASGSGKVKKRRNYAAQDRLTAEEAAYLNNYNRNRLLERRKQGLDSIEKETNDIVDFLTKKAAEAAKKAEKAEKATGTKKYTKPTYVETDKEKKAREKAERDAENTAQEKKDAEEKASNELLKLLQDNQKTELDLEEETTDKKLKLIELFYDRKKAEIEKKERELAELNKKAGKKGLNDKGLTEEQQREINKAKEIAQKEQDNQKKDVTQEKEKNDAEQRIAYMKEYGNYLDKYAAILEEFKMKREELSKDDEYGSKLLDKQQEEALGKLQKEVSDKQLKDLSWDTLFQNLDRYTTDYLVRLQQRLSAALDTATKENADLIKQKINEIDRIVASNKAGGSDNDILSQNGLLGGSPWGRAAQAIRKQNALEAKAAADSKALTDKQTEILDHYDELGGMDAKDITSKNPKLQGILSAEDMSALQGMEANAEMSGAEASGGQGATALAVTDAIIHGVNQNVQSLGEAADILFGEDSEMNKSVKKFAESSQYATDAFDSLKNGDIVGVALNLGNAISTLGESFGIWSNSNREEIEKENKRLADAMSFNTEALNRLTKKLSESSSATDKFKAYSQAENYLDANEQAQRHIIANNSRMYDGGHSLGYDFGEVSGSSNMLRRLEAFFGKNRGTYNGLAEFIENTSASEMEKFYASEQGVALFNEFSEMIAEASDAGNYQNWVKDLVDYMNTFGKDAREELENSFRAGVTGVTFDGFKDNFKSALMEMEKDVHDFTNDFEKSLMQSVLNARIEAKFGKELQALYNDWNDALASDNALSSQEIENLVSREENLTQRMIAERDRLAAITGYDDSYSSSEAKGSINAAKSMSDDTANELVGRVTAVQLTTEGIRGQNTVMAERMAMQITYMASLSDIAARNNATLCDILQQQVTSNSYLEDIVRYSRKIYEGWNSEIMLIRQQLQRM